MSPEILDLIGRLTVHSGMLMEDQSSEMLMRLPADPPAISARLDRLERTGKDLVAFATASKVLVRIATEDTPAD